MTADAERPTLLAAGESTCRCIGHKLTTPEVGGLEPSLGVGRYGINTLTAKCINCKIKKTERHHSPFLFPPIYFLPPSPFPVLIGGVVPVVAYNGPHSERVRIVTGGGDNFKEVDQYNCPWFI